MSRPRDLPEFMARRRIEKLESGKKKQRTVADAIRMARTIIYGEKGALRITLYSSRKDDITKEGFLMVLAGISAGGGTDLRSIRKSILMAPMYAGGILRFHVVTYAETIGDSFFLVQEIRPYLLQSASWRTFLKLKQYNVWVGWHAVPINRQSLGRTRCF
ncbi:hypothetical protein TNCV_3848521 [Trichonephila clavipes]|uniref:Uncharacterized protein n=1 Tax=Trichonephila clavipes TaxID=2585209 RepID=A0A8X6RD00_TRICX|nr:hypothetical protein TNCV_3848521 [Trichonephila clavipes]